VYVGCGVIQCKDSTSKTVSRPLLKIIKRWIANKLTKDMYRYSGTGYTGLMSKVLEKIALVVVPLATAVFSTLFIVFFMSTFMEMSVLETDSDRAEARVIEFRKEPPSIKNINPIQVTSVTYSFQANGQTYVDSALGNDKVGGTLSVLYAKENPNISTPTRVNVAERKVFSGLAAALTLFAGIGLTIVVARIFWRKVASKTGKRN
jgi:hypothetical protein